MERPAGQLMATFSGGSVVVQEVGLRSRSVNLVQCPRAARGLLLLLAVSQLALRSPGQQFGPGQIVTHAAGANSVFAADLDGDGDREVLSASWDDSTIAWYENTDGLGGFSPRHIITASANNPVSVSAADLDGDGDEDVLTAGDKTAFGWFENVDGQGAFGPRQDIDSAADAGTALLAADLDGDADQDLLSITRHGDDFYEERLAWYENTDGAGTFGAPRIVATVPGNFMLSQQLVPCVSDVDGDGDEDLLLARSMFQFFPGLVTIRVDWYENTDGLGNFGSAQQVVSAFENSSKPAIGLALVSADLDGDGDQDVVTSVGWQDAVVWYENLDGLGTFGSGLMLGPAALSASSLFAADLDQDGDQDLAAATQALGSAIVWYENPDGLGSFGAPHVITTAVDRPESVHVADLNGDGDLDVLSASSQDGKVAWYENLRVGLSATLLRLSISKGGSQIFELSAGAANRLRPYILLGSASGTSPGVFIDGFVLPLQADAYFHGTLSHPSRAILRGSVGFLDEHGAGRAAFLPSEGLGPSMAGLTLHHAYVVLDSGSAPGAPRLSLVSNPVSLEIVR